MKRITLLLTFFLTSFSFGQIIFEEDFEVITDLSAEGWTLYNDNNTVQPNYTFITDAWNIVSLTSENGNFTATTTSWFNPPGVADRWLITPPITLPAENTELSYKIRAHDDGAFADGYTLKISTSGTAKSDFTTDLIVVPNAPNATIASVPLTTIDLSAYSGQTIFLAWVNQHDDGNLLSLDNITIEQGCARPSGIVTDNFSSTSVDISWANDPGNFDIEFGVFPYALGEGGTQVSVTNANSYQFTNLMPGVSYNVFIRQNCGGGELSDYEEVIIGTTIDVVNTYPYSEDFEPDANQALITNFGVSRAGAQNWGFNLDDPTDMDTTNDYSFDGLSCFVSGNTLIDSTTDAILYIGPFNMQANNAYDISFQQRNFEVSSATRPNKDLNLLITQIPDGSSDTVLASFNDMDNITYQQRSGIFNPSTSGEYFIGFHDVSTSSAAITEGNAVFIDALLVNETLSVNDFITENFEYFVDSSNRLNLSANQSFEQLNLYNLLGKRVLSRKLNSQNEVIDLNELSSGVYLVQVQIDSINKTFKIVKK